MAAGVEAGVARLVSGSDTAGWVMIPDRGGEGVLSINRAGRKKFEGNGEVRQWRRWELDACFGQEGAAEGMYLA